MLRIIRTARVTLAKVRLGVCVQIYCELIQIDNERPIIGGTPPVFLLWLVCFGWVVWVKWWFLNHDFHHDFRLRSQKKVRKLQPGVRKPGAMWIPANVNWKFHLRPPPICPRVVAMENPSTSPMLHVVQRMNTPRAMWRLAWTRRLKATALSFLDLFDAGRTKWCCRKGFSKMAWVGSVSVCSAWCLLFWSLLIPFRTETFTPVGFFPFLSWFWYAFCRTTLAWHETIYNSRNGGISSGSFVADAR